VGEWYVEHAVFLHCPQLREHRVVAQQITLAAGRRPDGVGQQQHVGVTVEQGLAAHAQAAQVDLGEGVARPGGAEQGRDEGVFADAVQAVRLAIEVEHR